MRFALFGGTFDPIHRGHLAIAAAAANAFALESVLFAPTGHQPLKSDPALAAFPDRLAMTELACHADRRFAVSTLDAPRPDGAPNYTVHLLEQLLRAHPAADLYAIAGADSFLTLRQWREPGRLLALAEWIVVSRPGSSLSEEALATLQLTAAQRNRVHLVTTVHEEVSATALRERLANGDPCADLISPAVAEYIRNHGLYGWPALR